MIKITIYNWKKIVFKGILYLYNFVHYFILNTGGKHNGLQEFRC